MMLESPTEANTPMLYIKDGIDADMLFIVKPAALDMQSLYRIREDTFLFVEKRYPLILIL